MKTTISRALAGVGLAPAGQLQRLAEQVKRLENRVATLRAAAKTRNQRQAAAEVKALAWKKAAADAAAKTVALKEATANIKRLRAEHAKVLATRTKAEMRLQAHLAKARHKDYTAVRYVLATEPPCPGCASLALQALHIIPYAKRHVLLTSPWLALLGCQTCGLAFRAPRPTPETLEAFYDGQHDDGSNRRPPPSTAEMIGKRADAVAKLTPLGVLSPAPGQRALDFGCGAGGMLDVLQDAGWETVGIEPGRLASYASHRHRIINALPQVPTFDLVVVHHVLEHVLNPGHLMRQIAATCRPGARLLVGVPSLEGVAVTGDLKYAWSPVHINSFTRAALANLLRQTGWSPFSPAGIPGRTRIVMYGTRAASTLAPTPEALGPAICALRQFGRRLGRDGRFLVCPTAWPDTE